MAELIVDNFAIKENVINIDSNVMAITECLKETFLADAIGFVYCKEDGEIIDLEGDGIEVMKLILQSAYIPFVANVAAELGYTKS
jgi:hypothetical protein